MKIRGNTVGTTMPRTNWNQTNPAKADYLLGKEDLEKVIQAAQTAADNAQTAAENAKTAADNAQKTADEAKNSAGDFVSSSGGTITGELSMSGKKITNIGDPEEGADAANKGYVDSKHFTAEIILDADAWVGDAAPYTQTVAVEGILATDYPHYGLVYFDDLDTKLSQKEAFSLVDDLETADGSVTFTCLEDKPAFGMKIQLEVNR